MKRRSFMKRFFGGMFAVAIYCRLQQDYVHQVEVPNSTEPQRPQQKRQLVGWRAEIQRVIDEEPLYEVNDWWIRGLVISPEDLT